MYNYIKNFIILYLNFLFYHNNSLIGLFIIFIFVCRFVGFMDSLLLIIEVVLFWTINRLFFFSSMECCCCGCCCEVGVIGVGYTMVWCLFILSFVLFYHFFSCIISAFIFEYSFLLMLIHFYLSFIATIS